MKNFGTVLSFELKEYFKSKGFVITTFVIALLAIVGISLPRFIDFGFDKGLEGKIESMFSTDESEVVIYDENGNLSKDLVMQAFPKAQYVNSVSEVEDAIKNRDNKIDKGFVITGPTSYKAYVYNSEMFSSEDTVVSQLMSVSEGMKYAAEHNIDYAQLQSSMNPQINKEDIILGKDTQANYWYCYALVIVVFMMIIIYGQMIATSITTEKSNRSIEVLVTTTDSNSLLFGKVIAGAIASIFQMGIILGSALITYRMNRELWGGMLDPVLNIPNDVLITFLVFGLLGYLFYAFIYGAVGSLVSKTEDISKSSGGVMMIIMVVYFLSLIQLSNPDGIVMKVLSFLPFSSYSAMFSRVALGTVSIVEVIISAVILVVCVLGAGFLAAKIYRMGTLRYGNPIKLSAALKAIKQDKN